MVRVRRISLDPMAAFASASPGLAALAADADALAALIDAVHEGDALSLALTCTLMKDALWGRFPADDEQQIILGAGARTRTRPAAVVASASRLAWALELKPAQRPAWLQTGLGAEAANEADHREARCAGDAGVGAIEGGRTAP